MMESLANQGDVRLNQVGGLVPLLIEISLGQTDSAIQHSLVKRQRVGPKEKLVVAASIVVGRELQNKSIQAFQT